MKYKRRSLKDIPEHLRPREKLLKNGTSSLSDEELLAVILGSGTKGRDVLSLSKEVVNLGWERLKEIPVQELISYKGIGKVKALQIKALVELSLRISNPFSGVYINSPSDAYRFVKDKFSDRKESLVAVYLDISHRVIGFEVVAVGTVNTVYALPKDILYEAVKTSAYGILVAHNHPGGSSEPSKEDILFTERLSEACRILGFELVDHIVVDGDSKTFTSLKALGKL